LSDGAADGQLPGDAEQARCRPRCT